MKPFNLINESLRIIDELKTELKYSKNKFRDAKRINTLIKTLKCFNDMLVSKYKTDAIETLIYSLIYEYLLLYKAYENEIPLETIVYNIDFSISNGSWQKKQEVISILKTHELNNKIENNSVFDENYTNFDALLTNLLNQFKQNILWNSMK